MVTWAQKRQLGYFAVFMAVFLIIGGIIFYNIWYQRPTCFDNKKNGVETGVDCGGDCVKLCLAENLNPAVEWQQTFEVTPGIYSAVAYIQNPNISSESKNVPYIFKIYDSRNNVLAERAGTVNIPPGKNFAVFESNIGIDKTKKPARTTFEFTKEIEWRAGERGEILSVSNLSIVNATSSPVVEADIYNPSFDDIGRVNVVAIVYDTAGNAVGASRTYLDGIANRSLSHAVFTWPKGFPGQLGACQKTSDVMLAIDRSGSMSSDGKNPPEPMTSVKNAALSFVSNLRDGDRAGLVSYATFASSPVDQPLTASLVNVKSAIENVNIRQEDGTQYTNISDALDKSAAEIANTANIMGSKPAIILLTDGVATYPEKKGDDKYPANLARESAERIKEMGIEIFTIGLGKTIDESFLIEIASGEDHYYRAPLSSDLVSVYSDIASAMCEQGPAKVEIIPDIVPIK